MKIATSSAQAMSGLSLAPMSCRNRPRHFLSGRRSAQDQEIPPATVASPSTSRVCGKSSPVPGARVASRFRRTSRRAWRTATCLVHRGRYAAGRRWLGRPAVRPRSGAQYRSHHERLQGDRRQVDGSSPRHRAACARSCKRNWRSAVWRQRPASLLGRLRRSGNSSRRNSARSMTSCVRTVSCLATTKTKPVNVPMKLAEAAVSAVQPPVLNARSTWMCARRNSRSTRLMRCLPRASRS